MPEEKRARSRGRRRHDGRKDRLIQTRVASHLEEVLKREADKRRLTVSHLIRNTLEDAFHLVESVTSDVEQLVGSSVELASAVSRDARRLAAIVRGEPSANPEPGSSAEPGRSAEPGSGTEPGSSAEPGSSTEPGGSETKSASQQTTPPSQAEDVPGAQGARQPGAAEPSGARASEGVAPATPPSGDACTTSERPVAAEGSAAARGPEPDPLGHIYGWNRLVANRAASCARCHAEILKGDEALVGLSDDPSRPRAWLCVDCGDEL